MEVYTKVLTVDFEFTFNIAQVFSPLMLICLAVIANWVRVKVINHFDASHAADALIREERHKENTTRLDELKALATKTNGRVTSLEERVGADHDLLVGTAAKVETLEKRP